MLPSVIVTAESMLTAFVVRIRVRVSASYELQSSVNTNAPTKSDACATRNPRYNRALSALLLYI